MKFLPLIWAAFRRKPARAIFTFLSIIVAFLLFGLLMGLNASFAAFVDRARLDRINVGSRFGPNLPMAYTEQLPQIDGVTRVAPMDGLGGYYQNEDNRVFAFMVDERILDVIPETGLTREQFAALKRVRNGLLVSRTRAEQFGLKPGDQFPLQTMASVRKDGAKLWTFEVVAIVDDWVNAPAGFMVGNHDYLDEARLEKDHGKVGWYNLLVKDQERAAEISKAIEKRFANSQDPVRATPEKTMMQNGMTNVVDINFVTHAVVAAALFMILFLTGNGIAQSVRERVPEFAVMKTLGFSDGGVMALVFSEALIPFVIGAGLGLAAAQGLGLMINRVLPAGVILPPPVATTGVVVWAFVIAVAVALASAVLPALRVRRLQVAAALLGR